jgi:hypothetical protein
MSIYLDKVNFNRTLHQGLFIAPKENANTNNNKEENFSGTPSLGLVHEN